MRSSPIRILAAVAVVVLAVIGWNDGDSAESVTTSSVSLSTLVGSFATLNQVLRSGASQNITYSTTVAGALGTPKYALSVVLQRLT
jgi:hypothetical protein